MSVGGYALDLAVLAVLLFTGWTLRLRSLAEHLSAAPALALVIYLVLFGVILKVVSLPLDFAGGFWLEHRYNLSNLRLGGWIKDELKGVAVGGALAVLGFEFLYWTTRRWPAHWWVITAVAFIAFVVAAANLAPVLIFPLFFKFKPLDNPSLVARLLALSNRAGTRVAGVFEWKLSEKTKKANAALAGLGNTRRIILADTLLEKFSEEEVEAVLAHELGHHVHHDVFRGLAVQAVTAFAAFYLINVALVRFSGFFGLRGVSDFANLPLVVLVTMALSLVLLPLVNAHSRNRERRADAYALEAIAQKSAFISSMEKLAGLNLAERKPHPWIEFLFYSHPSIEKRIEFARKW